MGMTRDSSGFSAHPPGEQSLVVENERPDGVDLDSFFGPVRVEWGSRGGVDAAWATAVLHPFPQDERTVRRLGRRLSAALRQSQRAEEARRCGDGDARPA